MEEKTCKNGWGTIGEEGHLNRFPENPTVEAKKAQIPVLPDIPGTTGQSRYYRTIPGDPRSPNAPFSVPTGTTKRYYRTLVRYYRSSLNENGHNFCIRTPISMILGSFRRGQQALKDNAKKHYSRVREDRSK